MSVDDVIAKIFKLITYFLLVILSIISLWSINWHFSAEIIIVLLFLCAYTIILTLPIKRFKLSPTGFEGELERLTTPREVIPAQPETVEEVDKEVAELSQDLVEPDTILMRLSIEIETTLRSLAESAGVSRLKASMGQLTRILRQKEIITDQWLLDSLRFFTEYRNALLHEGKTTDIQKAISLGREVLVHLRQIQKRY